MPCCCEDPPEDVGRGDMAVDVVDDAQEYVVVGVVTIVSETFTQINHYV